MHERHRHNHNRYHKHPPHAEHADRQTAKHTRHDKADPANRARQSIGVCSLIFWHEQCNNCRKGNIAHVTNDRPEQYHPDK